MMTSLDSTVKIFFEEMDSASDNIVTDDAFMDNLNNYTQILADNNTKDNLTPSTKGSTTSIGYGEVLRTSLVLIGGLYTIATGT
jgi:hypothetical protein